ncbi:MAG: hypothetical protein ACUVWZ_00915 [Anaerolineae bacterium]
MEVGLLWYDNDPHRTLEDKVGRAAQRYHEKFGQWPNTCYVHPTALGGSATPDLYVVRLVQNPKAFIRVRPATNVLIHHLWLGISAENVPEQKAMRELRGNPLSGRQVNHQ